MKENIIPSLKLVYKPLIMYYGEWELLNGLEELSLEKKEKNMRNWLINFSYTHTKLIYQIYIKKDWKL